MSYEVEQKFPLFESSDIEERLVALGAQFGEPVEQADQYFAHPVRDFGQTDEALRIRCGPGSAVLTYKGPKLDQTTKTRKEIETELAGGASTAAQLADILILLGFTPVLQVRKHRRGAHIGWSGAEIDVALDQVEGLGPFLELEIVANDDQLDAARQAIQSLAQELGLSHSERRSYLQLLLEKNIS